MRDHPRSRGVYRTAKVKTPWSGGSSPLARGLLASPEFVANIDGIIPARAGFTQAGPVDLEVLRDHPRSRGVYWLFAFEGVVGGANRILRRLPSGGP